MAVSIIKKFHIFAHLSIKDALLEELQKLECVEIMQIDEKKVFQEWESVQEEDGGRNSSTEINKVKFCIELLSQFHKSEKKGIQSFFPQKETINYNKLVELSKETNYEDIYQQCREIDNHLNQLKSNENKLKTIEDEVREWKELDIDLSSLSNSKNIIYLLGSMAKSEIDDFINEAKNECNLMEIKKIREEKNTVNIIIISLKDSFESVMNIAQKYNFESYKYTHPFTGMPNEIMKNIAKQIDDISKKRLSLERQLREIVNKNKNIYKVYDYLSIDKEKDEISKYLKRSQESFVIKGWIQEKDIVKLKAKLNEKFDAYEVYFSDPQENENVPITLDNHKYVKPFEVITELYSLPSYFEIDPTPILSIFYFIFFGFCLSDVGYGAVLALLSYIAINKLGLEGSAKKFFRLLYYCGIAGIIGGVFVGSWFGDILNYLPPAFSWIRVILVDKLSLFNPTENPIPLLILSISLGVIQVYIGIILKFVHNIKKGKFIDGLMDQISWLLFLSGIILLFMAL